MRLVGFKDKNGKRVLFNPARIECVEQGGDYVHITTNYSLYTVDEPLRTVVEKINAALRG